MARTAVFMVITLYWIWRLIVVVFLFAETPTYGCLEMYEVSWGCIFEVEGCFERINFYHVSVENRREVRHNGFFYAMNVELVHFDTGLTSLLRERISEPNGHQTDGRRETKQLIFFLHLLEEKKKKWGDDPSHDVESKMWYNKQIKNSNISLY